MVCSSEALRVDLVDLLGTGGARGKPAILRKHLQPGLMKKGIRQPPVLGRIFVPFWTEYQRLFSVARGESPRVFPCTTQARVWWERFRALVARPRGSCGLP